MKRAGHYDHVPANALPPMLWKLVQAWLVSQRKSPRRRIRASKTR